MKTLLLFVFLLLHVRLLSDDFFPFQSEQALHEAMAELAGQTNITFPIREQRRTREEIELMAKREALTRLDLSEVIIDERAFVEEWQRKLPILQQGEYFAFVGLDKLQYRGNIRRFDDVLLVLGGFRIPARHIPPELMARRSAEARDKFIQSKYEEEKKNQVHLTNRRTLELENEIKNEFFKKEGYYAGKNGNWYNKQEIFDLLRKFSISREYSRIVTTGIDQANSLNDREGTSEAITLLQNLLIEYPEAPDLSPVNKLLSELKVAESGRLKGAESGMNMLQLLNLKENTSNRMGSSNGHGSYHSYDAAYNEAKRRNSRSEGIISANISAAANFSSYTKTIPAHRVQRYTVEYDPKTDKYLVVPDHR